MANKPNSSDNSHNIKMIVGLGNPGPQYALTRHNVGFWFIDEICKFTNSQLKLETKFHGQVADCLINSSKIKLLTPNTFMNLSGNAVLACANFYKILPENILVAHDDIDLPVGTIKLKLDGGHGGHNGLRDIINKIHTRKFYRLRIGVGHPGNSKEVHDYVLKRPSKSEEQVINNGINQAIDLLAEITNGNIEKAMQKLHTAN